MIAQGYGDNARYASFAQDTARLRMDLERLGTELGSGRKSDIATALGGDLSGLSDIRRSLRLNESYLQGLATAANRAGARQTTLDRFNSEIDSAGPELLAVVATGRSQELTLRLADAPQRFESAVAVLNTRYASQSLFSGDAPDQPALAAPDVILDELRTLVAAAPDTATALADIDAWFQNPGGGYETVAIIGGDPGAGQVYLTENQTTDIEVTVADPGLRTALAGMALATLAAEGSLTPEPDSQAVFAEAAAERMMQGERMVIDTSARLGVAEGRLEAARVQAEATRTALQLEEARMTEADPYQTATELENVSRQLESLFVLTARLSQLSLTNFIR